MDNLLSILSAIEAMHTSPLAPPEMPAPPLKCIRAGSEERLAVNALALPSSAIRVTIRRAARVLGHGRRDTCIFTRGRLGPSARLIVCSTTWC